MDTPTTDNVVNPESRIASFVLRFVYEEPPDGSQSASGWYSVIRHVQSDTERHFTSWQDIVGFISGYVDLSKGERGSISVEHADG